MQEADRHRLDAIRLEVVDDARERREVERPDFLATIGHAAGQLAAQVARHEGFRLLVVEIEEIGPVAARDLERVAEALRGDEADLDALALGERVDDDRGAMCEEVDRRRIDAALFQDVEHALLEIRRRGVGLRGDDARLSRIAIGLEADQIGKGAADIGGDADGLVLHCQAPLAEFMRSRRKAVAPGSFRRSEAATLSGV